MFNVLIFVMKNSFNCQWLDHCSN